MSNMFSEDVLKSCTKDFMNTCVSELKRDTTHVFHLTEKDGTGIVCYWVNGYAFKDDIEDCISKGTFGQRYVSGTLQQLLNNWIEDGLVIKGNTE